MHAIKYRTEHRLAAGFTEHPWAALPGRIVAHVLRVAAFELGHPMPLVIDAKANDSPWDAVRCVQVVDEW